MNNSIEKLDSNRITAPSPSGLEVLQADAAAAEVTRRLDILMDRMQSTLTEALLTNSIIERM